MRKNSFGYFLVLGSMLVFITACQNQQNGKNQNADSSTISTPIPSTDSVAKASTYENLADPSDSVVMDTDSIDFAKYQSEQPSSLAKAPLNWSSYPSATEFKTTITSAYEENDSAHFAGYYILATYGCGLSCIGGYMIDMRDGKIYDLPLGEENSCSNAEDRAVCYSSSKLFISAICKSSAKKNQPEYIAYLWNEENKNFNPIQKADFLIAK
jgi:hypothetical protein